MFNLHTRRKDSGTPACTLQRDAYNRCIRDAAAKPVKDVLDQTGTMLCGLDEQTVTAHRAQFGTNKVTHQKKQSLAQRVAGAFINPFTAILFFLALVSAVTDMLFPALSLFGSSDTDCAITEYPNIAFMGSNVISGSACGVVLAVGDNTLFGSMASAVAEEAVETSFTKGVNAVSWVLIRFMMVMVPLVFLINGLTKGDWLGAFLFGISIAVGLTPEMLPMIVTTCLAKGAVSMSRQKTIVKNLNSIQNFGAIDILCTDKTGTLTQDQVVLEYHMDVNGRDDLRVLRHAYLNSYFQTGYKNLMDVAIIRKTEESEAEDPRLVDLSEHYVKVDEIPFDFARRRLTTVVADKSGKT